MSTTSPSPQYSSPPKELLELWAKYEDVAMHFNDLMMRWRLQAIGGVVAVTTLAGAVVSQVHNDVNRYWAMLLLSLLLTFGWVGIAVIDLWYYRSLLRGAVSSLLEIECRIPSVTLSTDIEREAKRAGAIAPYLFYVCALVPLVFIVAYASWRLHSATG